MAKNQGYGISSEMLHQFITRVEKFEEEKKVVAEFISDTYKEAKANGFDTKTMRAIIRLRKMTPEEREEHEALVDLYKGSLGMLNGTPLGEAAIRRLEDERKRKKMEKGGKGIDPNEPIDETPKKQEPEDKRTIEDARKLAREAAKAGKPITDNPFGARDPKRAAWDEEWCKYTGSDGMELPEAWKRGAKKKEDKKGGK